MDNFVMLKHMKLAMNETARNKMRYNAMQTWDVYTLDGEWIETVFMDTGMSKSQVRRSLIDHDGYHDAIEVRKGR